MQKVQLVRTGRTCDAATCRRNSSERRKGVFACGRRVSAIEEETSLLGDVLPRICLKICRDRDARIDRFSTGCLVDNRSRKVPTAVRRAGGTRR